MKRMGSRVKKYIPQSLEGKVFLLTAIQSVGWLYIHCTIQFLLYRGGDLGEDWGILTIFAGWAVAILWSFFVCTYISKKIIGTSSISGFVIVGILTIPAGMISYLTLALILDAHHWGWEFFANFLRGVFWVVGFFGLLPEGREGTGAFLGWFFLTMVCMSYTGLYNTASKINKKNRS